MGNYFGGSFIGCVCSFNLVSARITWSFFENCFRNLGTSGSFSTCGVIGYTSSSSKRHCIELLGGLVFDYYFFTYFCSGSGLKSMRLPSPLSSAGGSGFYSTGGGSTHGSGLGYGFGLGFGYSLG